MKMALCIARCLTLLIVVATASGSEGFDRGEKNHFILCKDTSCAGAEGWVAAARPNVAHGANAQSMLLPDGKLLYAGGWPDGLLPLAELYDPDMGIWTFTGAMLRGRARASTTLLPDHRVMVAGGVVADVNSDMGFDGTPTAELYDPATGHWSATGSMHMVRGVHTATLLLNGQVLVAGGWNDDLLASAYEVLASTERYDPATGAWSMTGRLFEPRFGHTATLLRDGRVLVAGGMNDDVLASAEVFDPVAGTWSRVSDMGVPRAGHAATALPSGKVLVVGGYNDSTGASGVLGSAEIFDPDTGQWTPTGNLNEERSEHTATLLPNGNILIAGGYAGGKGSNVIHVIASTEVYDTDSGTWRLSAPLGDGRTGHTAALLLDGTVLVVGGMEFVNATESSYSTRPLNRAERSRIWP